MLPAPIEYRFRIEGETYVLVEWTRGGERRLRADFAMAIAASPSVMDSVDGKGLYAEAIARECLKEAPDIFWEELPAPAGQNGQPRRVINVDRVPRRIWNAFVKETDAFLALLFPEPVTVLAPGPGPGEGSPSSLAPAETVSAGFRGRAE